jgi:hypothetical protein
VWHAYLAPGWHRVGNPRGWDPNPAPLPAALVASQPNSCRLSRPLTPNENSNDDCDGGDDGGGGGDSVDDGDGGAIDDGGDDKDSDNGNDDNDSDDGEMRVMMEMMLTSPLAARPRRRRPQARRKCAAESNTAPSPLIYNVRCCLSKRVILLPIATLSCIAK